MSKSIVSGLIAVVLFGAGVASAQTYYPYNYSSNYSSASCVSLSSNLSYGSRGGEVSQLQTFLVNQNFPGGGSWMITGYFGNATLQALKNFQQQQGIAMTGVADATTRAEISRVSCGYSNTYSNTYSNSTYPYLTYPYNNYSYNYNYNNYTPVNSLPYSGSLALTSMSQNTGSAGESVTLFGTGFDSYSNTVYFGSQAIPGIASPNGASLTFTIPTYNAYSSNQSVKIYVSNSRGNSNSLSFTVVSYPYFCNNQFWYGYGYNNNCYQPQPQSNDLYSPFITYLNPASGAVGTEVTIVGSGFSTSGNAVHFGPGVVANVNSYDGHAVSFKVPSQLTGYGTQPVTLSTYQISVTNALGYSTNAMPFTVTSLGSSGVAPVITSVNGPASLQVGAQGTWTIQVTNPANAYLTTSVQWGDEGIYGAQTTQNLQQSGTTLTFTHTYYTAGTYAAKFTVSNASGSNSSTMTITISSAPIPSSNVTLTSIAPTVGPVGTQVTLYGTGFYGNNIIHFGSGAIPNVYSYNGTTLSFTVPYFIAPYCPPYSYVACPQYMQQVTPGSYNISVENQNGSSSALTFQVQ